MWGVWGVWLARKAVGHRLRRDGLARTRTLHIGGCVPPEAVTCVLTTD